MNLRKGLIAYYGVLQSLHFLALVSGFVYGMEKLMRQVSPGLTGDRATAMLFSSYIDVLVAAPLGVLFVFGYFRRKAWAAGVGTLSLHTAFFSAVFYSYILQAYDLFALTWLNTLISIAFLPMLLLYALMVKASLQGVHVLAPPQ